METYRQDAERENDVGLDALLTMAQNGSRRGLAIGKRLLIDRLPPVDVMAPIRSSEG